MKEKQHPIPNVGDTVVLNDAGLRAVFGTTIGLSHMKTHKMKITSVGAETMTDDVDTRIVEVDDKEINRFFLNNHDFDIVESV